MKISRELNIFIFLIYILITPAAAQVKDTIQQKSNVEKELQKIEIREAGNKRFLLRGVVPSGVLIGAGIYTMKGNGFFSSHDLFNYRNRSFPNFSTNADDFAMLAPLAGLYGINLISSSNRHELGRQTLLLLGCGILTSAMVWPLKDLTDIERPNGKPHAFPSGHTSYAFTIATFMDKEFRHRRPWISFVSYTIAGATGIVRILNNSHWMSDVLAGAGVGILSVNTIYWLHSKFIKDKDLNTSIVPVVLPGGQWGMSFTFKF